MILDNMMTAHEIMTQAAGQRPVLWRVSPATMEAVQKETGPLTYSMLRGLPVEVMPFWAFGWELISASQAARRGIQLP